MSKIKETEEGCGCIILCGLVIWAVVSVVTAYQNGQFDALERTKMKIEPAHEIWQKFDKLKKNYD